MGHPLPDIIVIALMLRYPAWRIFNRAGLNPVFGLSILIPGLGIFIFGLILALSNWNIRQSGD